MHERLFDALVFIITFGLTLGLFVGSHYMG